MSSSKSDNKTQTTDQRTTETLNAGIGGDIDESYVISGNKGDTSLDYTEVNQSSEYEFYDSSDRSFNDDSDNSFNLDYSDSRDQSQTFEYYDESDNSGQVNVGEGGHYAYTVNTTDGGAFELLEKLGSSFIEAQRETLSGAENITRQALSDAMAIKAGEALNERANSDLTAKLSTGVKVAAVAGVAYVAAKAMKG